MKSPKEKSTKKTYHRPQLVAYGNITELTQTIGTIGKNDGGSGSTKTG